MVSDINNPKEIIKNRMLRYALNYWNLRNAEDLDPMVKLLMEALSLELYNLGNETRDTQVRILEKIAGLLAPDFLTAPQPAHAVLHASPLEPTEIVPPTASFFTQTKIALRQPTATETALDVSFTPVDAVQLSDVSINWLAVNGNLFTYESPASRQLMARAGRGRYFENNSIWIGLRVNPKLETLNRLSFFFDWKNMESRLAQQVYQLLPLAKWFLNEHEIKTISGIEYNPRPKSLTGEESIFLEYDVLSLVEKDVKRFYDPKFLTITDQHPLRLVEQTRPCPDALKSVFAENDLQNMKEPLLWLKLVFPASLHPDYLSDVLIYPNAFPVINRGLSELKFRLKGGSSIIPLRTKAVDQFLSVKSLTDDTNEYKQIPYRKNAEESFGTFALRRGGVERFDDRNSREMISYLLEMLRSESAAFAAYGYDFIAGTLKEMNQKIALMEQKTRGYRTDGTEIPNYILVKPYEGKDMMYADYWTTLAEAANGLRAGTRLQQGKGAKAKADSLQLLTSTIGGKSRLGPDERLAAFRYGITTRDRIVTKEDIRNFCFYELGSRLQAVSIEKGFEVAGGSKEAFRRTINVKLIPFETDLLDRREWQVLCEGLQAKLEARSGMSNEYRISL